MLRASRLTKGQGCDMGRAEWSNIISISRNAILGHLPASFFPRSRSLAAAIQMFLRYISSFRKSSHAFRCPPDRRQLTLASPTIPRAEEPKHRSGARVQERYLEHRVSESMTIRTRTRVLNTRQFIRRK
jgi:hypothetical protein